MSGAAIKITMSQSSLHAIAKRRDSGKRLMRGIHDGLERALTEIENNLKVNYLSGRAGAGAGGKTPVGLRSGALRQAVTHKLDQPTSGYVGTARGAASAYARTILGDGDTVIHPNNAKHLWIPIADNLTRSGQMRMSPRAAIDQGARVFESQKGNLVAVLYQKGKGSHYKRGKKKGQRKGKLLFVLKDEVTIHGTDALAKAVEDKRERLSQLIEQGIEEALE